MPDSLSLCVVDSNILIDLHVGGLLQEVFRLPLRLVALKRLARDLEIPVVGLSDTTKEATRRVEEGRRIGQTGYRYSYEISHRADVLAEIRMGTDLLEMLAEKDANIKKLADAWPLGTYGDKFDTYAVLELSKQRSGATIPALFVYHRSFNWFEPMDTRIYQGR